MEDYRELKVEADTFDKMRADTNFILQRALGMMKEKDSMEGKVTINLDIKLVPEFIPNFDKEIEGETRRILKPQFAHKVTSAINIKNEKKGNFDSEMEMVWDEDEQAYVLKYINNTAQRSMFDDDMQEQWNQDGDNAHVIETSEEGYFVNIPLIEGEVADETALPGPILNYPEDDGYGYEDVV